MKNQRVSGLLNRIGPWVDRVFTAPRLAFLFAGLYLVVFLIPFPLAHWYNIPYVSFVSITHAAPLAAVSLVLAGLALIALNVQLGALPAGIRAAHCGGGCLLAGRCAVRAVHFSRSVYRYGDCIFRAHMLVHPHVNPLTTPPSSVIVWSPFPYPGLV